MIECLISLAAMGLLLPFAIQAPLRLLFRHGCADILWSSRIQHVCVFGDGHAYWLRQAAILSNWASLFSIFRGHRIHYDISLEILISAYFHFIFKIRY